MNKSFLSAVLLAFTSVSLTHSFHVANPSRGNLIPNCQTASLFTRYDIKTTRSAMSTDLASNAFGSETPTKKIRTGDSSNDPSTSTNASTINQTKGTIYITIGPQCSGKTTILQSIFGETFHKNDEAGGDANNQADSGGLDVTIDDQPLVYIPVDVNYFLHDTNNTVADRGGVSLGLEVMGKTIRERVNDVSNNEMRHVIQRMGGKISAEEFALLISGGSSNNTSQQSQSQPNHVSDDLISTVEEMVTNKASLPKNVELFIVESIFRPRPLDLMRNTTGNIAPNSTECSALDAAQNTLESHANNSQLHLSTAPIAWGNTNTRPREYTTAMEAAVQSGRPVEFIVFGGMEACDMIREHMDRREYRKAHEDAGEEQQNNATGANVKDESMCLPKLTRRELFMRNLHRFSKTGRYIPSTAINDAMVRVESLLASAAAEAKKSCVPNSEMTMEDAKFRLDYELVKLADYELNRDRTVRRSTRNGYSGGRGANFNHRNGQDTRGRYGRGPGRGRNYDNNFQGRHNNQGRWNRSHDPNYHYEVRGHNTHARGWEPRDRSGGRGYDNHHNNQTRSDYGGYSNTYSGRGRGRGPGRDNSQWQGRNNNGSYQGQGYRNNW